jgi:hypothetical protein
LLPEIPVVHPGKTLCKKGLQRVGKTTKNPHFPHVAGTEDVSFPAHGCRADGISSRPTSGRWSAINKVFAKFYKE